MIKSTGERMYTTVYPVDKNGNAKARVLWKQQPRREHDLKRSALI